MKYSFGLIPWFLFVFVLSTIPGPKTSELATPGESVPVRAPDQVPNAPAGLTSTPDPNGPTNCMQNLGPEFSSVLTAAKEHLIEVQRGLLLKEDAAEDLRKLIHEASKGNVKTEAVLATLSALEIENTRNAHMLWLFDQLSSGQPVAEFERKNLLSIFSDAKSASPEKALATVVQEAKPHFEKLKSNGAAMGEQGWEFKKFKWQNLKTDLDLQNSFSVFYPEIKTQIENWQKAKKPTLLTFGSMVLLPTGSAMSIAAYTKQTSYLLTNITNDLERFARFAQQSASFWDMTYGAYVALNPILKMQGYTDFQTKAEIEREAAYNRLATAVNYLEKNYAFDGEEIKTLRFLLGKNLEAQVAEIDLTLVKVRKAQIALSIIAGTALVADVVIIAVLTNVVAVAEGGTIARLAASVGPKLLRNFTVGLAVGGVDIAARAGLEKYHSGGSYLCQLAQKLAERGPGDLMWAAILAPMGFIPGALAPANIQLAARAASMEMTEGAAIVARKYILRLLALPGLYLTSKNLYEFGVLAYQDNVGAATARENGNFELANQLLAKRDQDILTAAEAGLLAYITFRVGFKSNPDIALGQKARDLDAYFKSRNVETITLQSREDFVRAAQNFLKARETVGQKYDPEFVQWFEKNQNKPEFMPLKKARMTVQEQITSIWEGWYLEKGYKEPGWWQKFGSIAKEPGAVMPKVKKALPVAAGGAIAFSKDLLEKGRAMVVRNMKKIMESSKDAVILGQSMRIIGALTDAPGAPLDAFLRKYGNILSAQLTSKEQVWLENFDKYHGDFDIYRQQTIQLLNMNKKQSADFMNILGLMGRKFSQFNQNITPDRQNGQNIMIGGMNDLSSYSANISNGIAIYYGYQDRVKALEAKKISNGGTLSSEDQKDLDKFTNLMRSTLNQAAGTLALYKVRLAFFQEGALRIAPGQDAKLEAMFEAIVVTQDPTFSFNELCEEKVKDILGDYLTEVNRRDKQVVQDMLRIKPELQKFFTSTNSPSSSQAN